MSLLKQIDERGAVLEWSPIAQHANLVALGTKVSLQVVMFILHIATNDKVLQ